MSDEEPPKKKPSIWTTIRIGWEPYKRLYSYALPYKFRFIMGLAFGFLYGGITGCLPLVMARVTSVAFGGHAIAPTALATHPELMNHGPKINSLVLFCLAIPAVMTLRSVCAYANTYYVAWVSNKVLTDIRTELFGKMVNHSMDFFNKAQSGFLMSRITNDTRMMQAALSSISSDLFKQPVAILTGISVLLYMDWKFTLVTLVLFPSCLVPLALYGKRARKAVQGEQFGLAQMVVTMQETFAGIRVIKSFARERHQEELFRRSNDSQFSASMRILRATEAVGPLDRDDRGHRRRPGAALRLRRPASRGEIHRANRRHLSSLRPDQVAQPHSHHHAAFHPGDGGNFPRFSIPRRPFRIDRTPSISRAPPARSRSSAFPSATKAGSPTRCKISASRSIGAGATRSSAQVARARARSFP